MMENKTVNQAHSAISVLVKKIAKLIAPPPNLKVSQWADEYRYLSSESSAEPGKWHTNRAPYQKEMMDAFNDPQIESVVVMSSAQIGKTEIINNIIGYYIHLDPAPILLLQPTLEMAESWSKDRFAPMLRDTPSLNDLVRDPRSKDSGNTLLHKRFPGGHITMAGANSPASLASRPIRLVLCDEVDRYPVSAGTEGDPVNLAKKRTTTFWNRKLLLTSTPTIKGFSRIEAAFLQSDQRRYFVPCPECGEVQTLKWLQVKWENGNPETAHYECEHCGFHITDSHKQEMLEKGCWRSTIISNSADDADANTKTNARTTSAAGFHINELYSPWVSFKQIVAEFLKAKLLPETLKTWVNTSLGETWEEEGESVDDEGLYKRREEFDKDLPEKVLLLTAGVDVQNDRLELEIVGWGENYESWSVDYIVIYGDPTSAKIWEELTLIIDKQFTHKSGIKLNISCTCIDSGGHHTQAVYDYVKNNNTRRVFAVKGSSQAGKPIVGKPILAGKQRAKLFSVGVDTAKEVIYSRLKITKLGAGYCHFPITRGSEYFKQLTAEKQVTRYVKGFAKREWIKVRTRNEALDCRVYSLAALQILNPDFELLAKNIEMKSRNIRKETRKQKSNSDSWVNTEGNWL
ncbi:MAG: phage terminase large subunit family protein [Rickettsiales bacterium]|nr:phage terminase large subunit family protein [Rickettsiales bacterium]